MLLRRTNHAYSFIFLLVRFGLAAAIRESALNGTFVRIPDIHHHQFCVSYSASLRLLAMVLCRSGAALMRVRV